MKFIRTFEDEDYYYGDLFLEQIGDTDWYIQIDVNCPYYVQLGKKKNGGDYIRRIQLHTPDDLSVLSPFDKVTVQHLVSKKYGKMNLEKINGTDWYIQVDKIRPAYVKLREKNGRYFIKKFDSDIPEEVRDLARQCRQ